MNDISYTKSGECRKILSEIIGVNRDCFSPPKSLYKYSKISKRLVENIINGKISLSNPSKFNDVYDSFLQAETISKLRFEILSVRDMLLSADNSLNKSLMKRISKIDNHRAEKMMKGLRITCFSTRENDIKMWGHYGGSNKGICIEYDLESNNIFDGLLFPVIYKNKPINVSKLCDEGKILQALLACAIVKNRIWKYESEWRIIIPIAKSNAPDYIDIINAPKIKRIILGKNYQYKKMTNFEEKESAKKLYQFVKENGITIYKCTSLMHTFDIGIDQVDGDEILS